MRYWCKSCKQEFEAAEERCPKCLRQSSVVPASERSGRGASGRRPGRLSPLGLVVVCLVLVPYSVMNWMNWHLPWWVTFFAAVVAFGTGHLFDLWRASRKNKDHS